jgi:hypothetical protein
MYFCPFENGQNSGFRPLILIPLLWRGKAAGHLSIQDRTGRSVLHPQLGTQ